jgi:hypothetical protein
MNVSAVRAIEVREFEHDEISTTVTTIDLELLFPMLHVTRQDRTVCGSRYLHVHAVIPMNPASSAATVPALGVASLPSCETSQSS